MIRVNIVCEGQTEENFVKQILAPHLIPLGVNPTPHNLGTGASYQKLKNRVLQWLKEEPTTWVTTMVDLYAMPDDYAGFEENKHKQPLDKIKGLEAAFKADIEKAGLANWRFLPNYQLHEFEALLFSDPLKMEQWLGLDFKIEAGAFTSIRESVDTPEEINSNRKQSPSWRIKNLIKSYRKPTHGMVVAKEIGLAKMREECTHFDAWVTALENLAQAAQAGMP